VNYDQSVDDKDNVLRRLPVTQATKNRYLSKIQGGTVIWNDWRRRQKRRIDLTNINLQGQILPSVEFIDVDLRGSDLSKSSINGGDFRDSDLSGTNFREVTAGWFSAINCCFDKSTFYGIDFYASRLTNSSFKQTDFTGANLYRARIDDCNFRGANLRGADFSDAILINVDLTEADLTNSKFTNASVFDIHTDTEGLLWLVAESPKILVTSTLQI
jgi:uncharacterized protein YjbI with pentapeptide repeats